MKKKTLSANAPKLVSLFSGCGGMDVGFEQAGFRRVFANDFDKDAQRVFKLNLGDIDPRDVRTIPESEIPDCDILTAGFPCQPFSNAGLRKGVKDARGTLYLECLRIVRAKLPKVVVFENVKGLMSSKNLDGTPMVTVIKNDLSDMGYSVVAQVVKAFDFEVPQKRERLIFVAFRKDLNKTFTFPKKIPQSDKLLLGSILNIPENVPNQVAWDFSPQAQALVEQIPEGGSWKSVPYENLPPRLKKIRDQMARYHAPNFYRRFARNEIPGTITASAQPENCGIIHPTENRRFTIREIARIQTFPDDFLFFDETLKDITAMYKVIGNAVPCRLAYHIASAIMKEAFND
ncbi:MAG: DNA cytosine methyltransferase [Candidatus Enteromonas sp.]|nr:DNA cytosine methyltransferase [Candidatus Enteromonas sp.]